MYTYDYEEKVLKNVSCGNAPLRGLKRWPIVKYSNHKYKKKKMREGCAFYRKDQANFTR